MITIRDGEKVRQIDLIEFKFLLVAKECGARRIGEEVAKLKC